MPMPPTIKEIPAIEAKKIVKVFVI